MSHYYTDNKDLISNRKEFTYYFDNEIFRFTTDNGVFSKEDVDYGSYILIKTIYKLIGKGRFLDLGSGYGPIGIIIKHFNPNVDVDMVDVNSRAVELADINCKNNKTDIRVYLLDDILRLDEDYDYIALNPPIRAGKKVIYELYEKSYAKLKDDSHLYIVIRKAHGANSSIKKLETIFKEVQIINKDSGYFVIDCHKYSK